MPNDKSDAENPGNDNEIPPVVVLDQHRGMAAQKATDERRTSSAVEADQETLRRERAELEEVLFAGPARGWLEVAERAAYLLKRYAEEPQAQDPRYQRMISDALDDLTRLSAETSDTDTGQS